MGRSCFVVKEIVISTNPSDPAEVGAEVHLNRLKVGGERK